MLGFNEAIRIGTEMYRTCKYSPTIRCAFQSTAYLLEEYFVSRGTEYSAEAAKAWLALPGNDHEGRRKSLAVLDEILQKGSSTLILKQDERFQYKNLQEWIKQIVDRYLDSLNLGPSRIRTIRNNCSFFGHFLKLHEITDLNCVTIEIIDIFFQYTDQNKTKKTSAVCKNDIVNFLKYAAICELITESNWTSITSFIKPPPDPLCEDEKARILSMISTESSILTEQWADFAEKYIKHMELCGYSSSACTVARKVIREFKQFIEVNRLPYATPLVDDWLTRNQIHWSHTKYLENYKTLMHINEMIISGGVRTYFFYNHQPQPDTIPTWCLPAWNEYIELREKEALAKSTMSMIKNSCKRFFDYLVSHEIHAWSEITPWNIKDFHDNDKHLTAEGHNAYSSRVCMFLEFLADKEIVSNTLSLAMTTKAAPKSRIISILNNDQIQTFYDFRLHASSPTELRATAIAMLGLCLGLRSIDIVSLRLQDISWGKDVMISIIQQKTGKPLSLPVPVDVGNSLHRYIESGRPTNAKTDKVFVALRAPYSQLSRIVCERSMQTIFGMEIAKALKGFHIMRRTQASNLLRSGNDVETIVNILGQSQTVSVERYLSTDEENMRLCTIDLAGIEYIGGWEI